MKKISKIYFSFILFSSLFLTGITLGSVLDLKTYQKDVFANNKMYQGLKDRVESFEKKKSEASIMYSPYLFANYYYSKDERENINPSFMGTRTLAKNYEVGLGQLTPWGQNISLSYKSLYSDLKGTLLTTPTAYEVGPKLELTQSLWRNFFGSETRAKNKSIVSHNYSQFYDDRFNLSQFEESVKMMYLQTYIAKESLKLQKEALSHANEIMSWAKGRYQRQLGDESDYLQAQAQVLAKEYEVKSAEDIYQNMEKKFQSLRGKEESAINETLAPLDISTLTSYKPSTDYHTRDDISSLYSKLDYLSYQQDIQAESHRPTFEFYGQLLYQGRDKNYSISEEEAWDKKNEWWVVGFRFSAPLFFWDSIDNVKAYQVSSASQALIKEQKELEAKSEWLKLQEELKELKEKLSISKKLTQIQKRKIEVERKRLRHGKTTTYQVLTFELDHLNAELLHLKTQSDLLNVISSLEMYKDKNNE